ncbi:F-box/kelch-repeat protein OR23 [Acorus calamus]|uniref:F-box/kelch-repeat protein OR23 n=1 Tax=Acorus calamus TaxID=4465 RepID=A0AAV9CIL7_ACOCL|nr:F-box/kelch-repeat protein OR23 [Acorus calamus]
MSTSHHHDGHEEQQTELIPGLPTDISTRILTQIPPHHHPRLRSTSRIWRSFFSPSSILPLRHHLLPLHLHHLLLLFPRDPSLSSPILLHLPRHRHHHLAFTHLPHLPCSPHFYALSNFLPIPLPLHRLLLLGGSRFDNRSFPPDLPVPSPDVHSFDFASSAWSPLPPMLTPRGGFACGVGAGGVVIVAGGGSRHGLFGAGGGSRIGSVEVLDLGGRGGWEERARMPRPRAGCVGFSVGEREFWVMGGYGDYRAVGGVLPVDMHCRDAVVYDLERDEWREVGDMWQEGERERLGAVAVVEGEGGARVPGVYMLDRNDIFR